MADNIGVLIGELRGLRDEIKEVNSRFEDELSPLKVKETDLEAKLVAEIEKLGLKAAKNGALTAAIQTLILPRIEDFDKFSSFVLRHKALHLLERRVGRNAYKELLESRKGKDIPGLSHIEKKSITLHASGK